MGAIFAATDSVATLQVLDRHSMPGLFSLVFGEGVINDATSVVLLGAVNRSYEGHKGGGAIAGGLVTNFLYLLVTSLVLGCSAGLFIAFVLKTMKFSGPHQVSTSNTATSLKQPA